MLPALLQPHVKASDGPVAGRTTAELVALLGTPTGSGAGPAGEAAGRRGELRLLDALIRLGPYGDGFGATPDGLTLDRVAEHEHGLDLGPLAPRLPQVLRTPSGRVELAPAEILADLPRLRAALAEPVDGLRLVGRRHLRSNMVEVTDRIRPGAVSLPHGWGHDGGGRLTVAGTADGSGGANTNVLTPPEVDPLSGTAILNGISVTVRPA